MDVVMGAGVPPTPSPAFTSVSNPCVTRTHFSLQVQHVYPTQVQYVEGGDAVYANGAMYVCSIRALVPTPDSQFHCSLWAGVEVVELSQSFSLTPNPQVSVQGHGFFVLGF